MSSTWKKFPLQELTENNSPITYGVVKPGEVGDVLFIRGGDLANGRILSSQLRTITHEVSKQYERTVLRGGELLISLVGQPGQVAVVPSEFAGANIARQVGLIRLRRGIDANFICYFLQSPDGRKALGKYTGGSVQQVINLCDLRILSTPNPSLSEQKRIVAIVDQAFEAIDVAIENTKQNLANARELFESYLNDVFARKMGSWKEGKLSEIGGKAFTGPFGSLLHKSDYISNGIPIVNPANIEDGIIIPNLNKTINQETANRLKNYILRQNDVVVGRRGEIGRCAVVGEEHSGWLCGSGSFFINPFENVNSIFFAHLLRSETYRSKLEALSTGATMQNLSNQSLSDLVIAMPTLNEQNQITRKLDVLRTETQRLEAIYRQKLAALTELKQSILQKAFTGELTADQESP
jgi:type I restriction enzyme, S subunit